MAQVLFVLQNCKIDQDVRTLNFSDLTEEEKLQYIEFIAVNRIEFEEDSEDERYIARVRIRKGNEDENNKSKVERQENNKSLTKSNSSLKLSESLTRASSYSSKQSKKPTQDYQKENFKSPFVLACKK